MIFIWLAFVYLPVLVYCHPSNLICDDPRLKEGGMMMHNYVVPNPYVSDSDISFTASATQYKYGEAVKFVVSASSSSKYLGTFLAVTVEFTGPNGGAMGQFHDLSDDLALVSGCSSTIYSKTDGGAFAGKSTFSWTPHNDGILETTGNATFKLIWGNGPGGGDPLAHLVKVADPYLYMKTIDLWDPQHWNPTSPTSPPTPSPPDQKCVRKNYPVGHTYRDSPVFIQHLKEGTQTFATKRCLKCRLDHRCRSAKVECPATLGAPVVEHIWLNSDRCEGPPSHSAVTPQGYNICPGEKHHSPFEIDLERFVTKLQRDHPKYFTNNKTAEESIKEYRKMLFLVQNYPDSAVVPSKLVDLVWHSHILDTEQYKRDSLRMFGYYLDHSPSFGGAEEKQELVEQQKLMFKKYELQFGKVPPIWKSENGVAEFDGGEKVPDCCAALCVKPNCANCVGCNAVDCGYANSKVGNKRKLMSPEQFSGYVPTDKPQPIPKTLDCSPFCKESFLCKVSPMDKMSIYWTIHDDYIYFQQEFMGMGWYGIGLNNVSGMGLADYMVSLYGLNYTGVKDMYKYDAANGYPCWDVLHECSKGNTTKGTYDLNDAKIQRDKGYTVSSWNRKLVTSDYKDYAITNNDATVLFGYGDNDWFNYHGSNIKSCSINFFSSRNNCNS